MKKSVRKKATKAKPAKRSTLSMACAQCGVNVKGSLFLRDVHGRPWHAACPP